MPYRKLLIFAGALCCASSSFAQNQSPSPGSPGPSPSSTPFVVDQSGAELTPRSTPAANGGATPIAPPTPEDKPITAKPVIEQPAAAPADGGLARAMPASPQEIITRLQIFLDQKNFGPGKIDGGWGEFTAKALLRYQMASGESPTGVIDAEMQKQLDHVFPIYTNYTITNDDLGRIDPALPWKPVEQAKKKVMPYRSFGEFIGERFHSSPDFIVKLNRGINLDKAKAGTVIRVPNVPAFKIEDFKEVADVGANKTVGQPGNPRMVRIDTKYRMLDIFDGHRLVSSFPITPGSKRLPAPIGTWKIVGVATMPWFRWDNAMLNHGYRSDEYFNIPPGPRNPVGIAWIGLNRRGIGIHGTNSPDTIGRAGSHGCIRLANWDAARVIHQVADGMTVEIY
jgi:lipoprotein-anchoring transpeptidase ErfK/SrfK